MTTVPPDGGTGTGTGAGPLAGLRVLVPRPPLDAPGDTAPSPAAIALRAVGAEPVVVPLVRTAPVDDTTVLDDALLALGAGWYGWLAVTSQAAVAVLADRAAATDDGLADVVARGGARVAAVGPGTRRALEAVGVRVDVVPPVRSTAVDLVAAWPALPADARDPDGRAAAGRVLFPRGDLAAPTLADGLSAAGWSVDDPVVYRTVPAGPPEPAVARAWAAGDVDAVLLTSASTVRALVDHLGPPPAGTRVAVIGPSTEAEAVRLGLRVDAVAAEQTLFGLVAALAGVVGPSAPGPTPSPTHPEDTP